MPSAPPPTRLLAGALTSTRPVDRSMTPRSPRRARWRGWVVGWGALLASVVLTALPAAAHDQLIETTPADASVVEVAPSEVTLRFGAEVMDISSQVIVRGPTGEVVLDTEAVIAGVLVSAPLPADLGQGTHTVAWRVVSGDGHPLQGSFTFSIGTAGEALSGEPASPSPSSAPTPAPAATAESSSSSSAPVAAGAAALAAAGVGALLWRRNRRTP